MASSTLSVTIFLCISFLLFLSAYANEVTVGGKSGDWKIPPSSTYSFNEWAQKARFNVGDFLGIYTPRFVVTPDFVQPLRNPQILFRQLRFFRFQVDILCNCDNTLFLTLPHVYFSFQVRSR